MKTISRSEILAKLAEWSSSRISPVEMHKWAVDLHTCDDLDFQDWEDNRRFSVSKEALAELEMLDINLVTRDDTPVFVAFLETPSGQFEKGYIPFISALQQIDRNKRKKLLKKIEPYARHCK